LKVNSLWQLRQIQEGVFKNGVGVRHLLRTEKHLGLEAAETPRSDAIL
jgi:hypothetical protein